uniref:Uncharacterized protein n=1 Tax=Arundo donax TaxID=35708 RepID=A0A0A9HID4_ARUDO
MRYTVHARPTTILSNSEYCVTNSNTYAHPCRLLGTSMPHPQNENKHFKCLLIFL